MREKDVVLMGCLAPGLLAQSPSVGRRFEVASVRSATMTPREALDAGRMAGMRVDGAQLSIGLGSMTFLISTAYRIDASRISGPAWMTDQLFDIDAKIPDGATKEQVPEMLQWLLAERFKLVLHREQRQEQVYSLGLNQEGPPLK